VTASIGAVITRGINAKAVGLPATAIASPSSTPHRALLAIECTISAAPSSTRASSP
jgi:hypothetical protein